MQQKQHGYIMVLVLVALAALSIVGASLLSTTHSQYAVTTHEVIANNAIYVAEAGVEQSLNQLNANNNFAGYSTPQTFFDNTNQGYGAFTVTISPASGNTNAKVITSTGKIYSHSNHMKLIAQRIVQVTTIGTASNTYSVMTGPGGLIMNNGASIGNSDVYVGGTISMTGGTSIGTSAKPINVNVGNKACLSGSTYPALCSGTQPITITNGAAIYGNVCATGQTNATGIKTGSGGTGLQPGCTAPDVSEPTYNRAAQIAAVTSSLNASTSKTYDCKGNMTVTWPANSRIYGNVDVAGGCNLTIAGNVYITGSFTIEGGSSVKVADSVGGTRPTVLVDGIVTLSNGGKIVENASSVGLYIISWASNAACNPGCTSMTGSELKTSSTYTTLTVNGGASAPGSILQSYWGKALINNGGKISAVAGQTIDLEGGSYTFGTVLSSGTSTWTMSSYQILYPGQ